MVETSKLGIMLQSNAQQLFQGWMEKYACTSLIDFIASHCSELILKNCLIFRLQLNRTFSVHVHVHEQNFNHISQEILFTNVNGTSITFPVNVNFHSFFKGQNMVYFIYIRRKYSGLNFKAVLIQTLCFSLSTLKFQKVFFDKMADFAELDLRNC